PLKSFLEFHMHKNGIATISMKEIDEPKQYGVVLLDPEQKIQVFLEKPTSQELYLSSFIQQSDEIRASNLINTGLYAFKREILDLLLKDNSLMDFGKNVFPYLLENGFSIFGFVERYYWMDVGQAKPYLWANWDLLRGYGWPVTPRGTDHDGLWFDVAPDAGENLVIEPPCALGSVNLGNNVHIKTLTTLNDQVSIGDNTIIERSTVWENTKIGRDCNFYESIICNDVTIGDNVSLIGCIVGPGSVIEENQKLEYKKIVRDT
ncbi:MAG: sugar phosphate nucleotidyltransferase, partial [Promethearchaeota archaeon]